MARYKLNAKGGKMEKIVKISKKDLRKAWDKIKHSDKEKSDIKFEKLCIELGL